MRSRPRHLLLALPLLLGLTLWPMAKNARHKAQVKAATFGLQQEIDRSDRVKGVPRLSVIRTLLKEGGDVNVRGASGFTLLHAAANNTRQTWTDPPYLDTEPERVALVRFLLAQGADINAKATINETPLMVAIESVQPKIVRLLLDKGAKINQRTAEYESGGTLIGKNELGLAYEVGCRTNENWQYMMGIGAMPSKAQHNLDAFNRDLDHINEILKAAGARDD